jgi:hypothetical protein
MAMSCKIWTQEFTAFINFHQLSSTFISSYHFLQIPGVKPKKSITFCAAWVCLKTGIQVSPIFAQTYMLASIQPSMQILIAKQQTYTKDMKVCTCHA